MDTIERRHDAGRHESGDSDPQPSFCEARTPNNSGSTPASPAAVTAAWLGELVGAETGGVVRFNDKRGAGASVDEPWRGDPG